MTCILDAAVRFSCWDVWAAVQRGSGVGFEAAGRSGCGLEAGEIARPDGRWRVRRSGCEERGGDDGDAVAAAVGVGAGGDDGGVCEAGADGAAEPVQVADVVV